MSFNNADKLNKFDNPIFVGKRIIALRDFQANIKFIETCLFELKRRVELEKRQRETTNENL